MPGNCACQLAHARMLMSAAALDFPLVHASAESTGLADESFDIIVCDHEATSSFCNDRDREWARRWPMEHIWRARKTSLPRTAQ